MNLMNIKSRAIDQILILKFPDAKATILESLENEDALHEFKFTECSRETKHTKTQQKILKPQQKILRNKKR